MSNFRAHQMPKLNLTHLLQRKVLKNISPRFNALDRYNLHPRCINNHSQESLLAFIKLWCNCKCRPLTFPAQTINRNQTRHFGSVRTFKIRDTVGGQAALCWVRFVTASSKVPIWRSKHCSWRTIALPFHYYCMFASMNEVGDEPFRPSLFAETDHIPIFSQFLTVS